MAEWLAGTKWCLPCHSQQLKIRNSCNCKFSTRYRSVQYNHKLYDTRFFSSRRERPLIARGGCQTGASRLWPVMGNAAAAAVPMLQQLVFTLSHTHFDPQAHTRARQLATLIFDDIVN